MVGSRAIALCACAAPCAAPYASRVCAQVQRSSAGFGGWIDAFADLDVGGHDDEDGLLVSGAEDESGDSDDGRGGCAPLRAGDAEEEAALQRALLESVGVRFAGGEEDREGVAD